MMTIRKGIFVFAVLLILTGCQTSIYHGPKSNHFNGTRFYNPGKYSTTFDPSSLQIDPLPVFPRKTNKSLPPVIHGNEIGVTFINHSTVLIQTMQLNILTDPIWSNRAGPFLMFGAARHREPGVSFDKLPPIDAVLISHNH